jgi:tetratricopeptide (TPR) repeat protein
MKQGDLAGTLESYRKSVAISEQLTKIDPSNATWRRTLLVELNKVGDVEREQNNLTDALSSYQAGVEIITKLAQSDRKNALWQADLSNSYDKLGDVKVTQGDFADALKFYRDAFAITNRLAKSDPSSADLQRDLSISWDKIAYVEQNKGIFSDALQSYRNSLIIRQQLVALDASNKQAADDLQYVIGWIGGLAYPAIVGRDFATALQCADQAISLTSDQLWLYGNRAHALMFLGRTSEARAIYLKYRGEKINDQGDIWDAAILKDFAEFRKQGLFNALMDEIGRLFTSG